MLTPKVTLQQLQITQPQDSWFRSIQVEIWWMLIKTAVANSGRIPGKKSHMGKSFNNFIEKPRYNFMEIEF